MKSPSPVSMEKKKGSIFFKSLSFLQDDKEPEIRSNELFLFCRLVLFFVFSGPMDVRHDGHIGLNDNFDENKIKELAEMSMSKIKSVEKDKEKASEKEFKVKVRNIKAKPLNDSKKKIISNFSVCSFFPCFF